MISQVWKKHHFTRSDTVATETSAPHAFEDELFFTLRQQRNNWARVAVGSVVVAVLSVGCLICILPLSQTKPFVIMVDKTTGQAEKIVEVRPATLDQQDVVRQAELVSYIVDRETYDPADNAVRIPDVMGRSSDNAADTLAELWSSGSSQYPPTIYGADVRVRVVVKSISLNPLNPRSGDVARVRITKIREEKGGRSAERSFIVTIGYAFHPKDNATLATVWHNPLGFTVTSYRIDAETAG
ncbi:virB8 family protein [Rhizobium ruizarguesonis]